MTAAHPVASRSPDRTSVCRAGRSVLSQCEMVTGPGFSSPNQPDQERVTAYRDSPRPDSRSDAHCAAIVGEWEGRSGESRPNALSPPRIDGKPGRSRWFTDRLSPIPRSPVANCPQKFDIRQTTRLGEVFLWRTFMPPLTDHI